MKKCMILSIIACALMSSNVSWSMLRISRTCQYSHSKRFYTTKFVGLSSKKDIHNSSELEITTNAGILLEDMYDRNQRLAELLHKQTERNNELLELIKKQDLIAIDHTFNNESLDVFTLRTLEHYIREKAQNDFYFSQLFHEKKVRGHADE